MNITPKELEAACSTSYSTFCAVMQDEGWFDPIHAKLCNWLQFHTEAAIASGKDCTLAVVMPRGSLKSTIVTKYFPAWMTTHDHVTPSGTMPGPDTRTLIATNTLPNARKKLDDIRGLFDGNAQFRAIYPHLLPTRDSRKWTSEAAIIPRPHDFPDATFEAAGQRSRKVGSHFNIILEDDTVAPDETEMKIDITLPTKETIERAIGWHKAATPLLVPKGVRIRLIVTTRWGDFDLIQYLRENENYHLFDMPAMAPDGNPNFTMFYDIDKLMEIKAQVGPYMFACLYLNTPMDATLRTFKKEWIEYRGVDKIPPPTAKSITICVDPAISERDDACETAITSVQHHMQGRFPIQYWRDAIHDHLNPNQTVQQTLDLAESYGFENVRAIIIETNAYQAALKYAFRDEMARRGTIFNLIKENSRTKKEIRIEGMVPLFANGQIFLRSGISSQVESQLIQYPMGKLVDVIDSFAMHRRFTKGVKRVPKPTVFPQSLDPQTFDAAIAEILKKKIDLTTGPKSGLEPEMAFMSGPASGVDAAHASMFDMVGLS